MKTIGEFFDTIHIEDRINIGGFLSRTHRVLRSEPCTSMEELFNRVMPKDNAKLPAWAKLKNKYCNNWITKYLIK